MSTLMDIHLPYRHLWIYISPIDFTHPKKPFHCPKFTHSNQTLFLTLPLDGHFLRICLFKTLPNKNPVGKQILAKKKEYNILI